MKKFVNTIKLLAVIIVLLELCFICGCQNNEEVVYIEDSNLIENDIASTPIPATPSPSPEVTERPKIIRDDADFRNAKWGDSIEDVLEYDYDATLTRDGDDLIGDCVVADKNAEVYYIFENDKLVSGGYYFDLDTSNGWRYISAYDEIKSMLLEVYGDPIVDKIHYVYGESLTDFMDDVLALEAGYTVYAAQWETNTTEILLGMFAENYDINFLLTYEDINYEEPKDYSGL